MHKIPTVIQSFKCLCIILDLQLRHKYKHKHNTNKHNTPTFTWFTTNEVATSTWTLSLLYAVKGIQSFYYALFAISLSSLFSEPLCTKQPECSLLSCLRPIHLAIRYARQKGSSIDVLISFPFTIHSSYIEWLRSLRLHSCGPKAPHPQNLLQYGPKPLQNGVKTLLVLDFCVVITAMCLVSSATLQKILGHVLKTAQLPRSYFPAPIWRHWPWQWHGWWIQWWWQPST